MGLRQQKLAKSVQTDAQTGVQSPRRTALAVLLLLKSIEHLKYLLQVKALRALTGEATGPKDKQQALFRACLRQ